MNKSSKTLAVILLLIIFACLLTACSKDLPELQEKAYYSIIIEGGYINGDPSLISGMFEEGEEITLTPIIPEGKKFLKWYKTGIPSGKLSGEENLIFKVGSNRNISAAFVDKDADIYSISVSNGYINGDKDIISTEFPEGTEIEITSSISSLQKFDGWYENGECVSQDEKYKFIIDKSRSLIAKSTDMNFYSIKVKGGNISSTGRAIEGEEIVFSAFENENNAEFEKWEIIVNGIKNEYLTKNVTVKISADTEAEAFYYDKIPVTAYVLGETEPIDRVFITKNIGGTEFTAPTLSSKTFIAWKNEDGEIIGTNKNIEIKNIASASSIFACYVEVEEGYSKLEVSNGEIYTAFSGGLYTGKLGNIAILPINTTVYIKPNVENADIYAVSQYPNVSRHSIDKTNGYSYTLTALINNIECPTLNTYTVSVSNGYLDEIGGKISGTYPEGSSIKIVAELSNFEIFVGWYENNKMVSTNETYSFVVSKNVALEARGILKSFYNISVTGGNINSSNSVVSGSEVTFTAIEDTERNEFVKWEVTKGITKTEYTSRSITLTIDSNTSAVAVFSEKYLVSAFLENNLAPFDSKYVVKSNGISFTAPSIEGLTFLCWKDSEGNILDAEKTIEISNIQEDKSVFASYFDVAEGYSKIKVIDGELYKSYLNGVYLYNLGNETTVKIGEAVYVKPNMDSSEVTILSIIPLEETETAIKFQGYKFIPTALSYEIECSCDIFPEIEPLGSFTTTVSNATQQMDTGIALTKNNTYIVKCNNEIEIGAINIFVGTDYAHYTRVFAGNKIVCFRPNVSANLKLFNCSAYADGTSYIGNIDFSVFEYSDTNATSLHMPIEYIVDLSYNPEEGYNSFTQAIMDLIDDEREKTIYLNSGTYDIFKEYHDFEMPIYEGSNPTEEYIDYCAHIPTNTHVLGIGDVKVVWMPDPKKTNLTMLESETVAPINVFGSCFLENFEIYCQNGRYCIHDDPLGDIRYTGAVKIYKDLKCYRYQNDVDDEGNEFGFNGCIGFGMDSSMHYEFINCVFQDFEKEGPAFYMHDRCLLNNKTQLVPTEESSEVFVYNCQILLSDNAEIGNGVELYNERPMYSYATGERVNVKWTGEAYNNNQMPIRHCRVYFEKTYIDGKIALLGTKGGPTGNICYNAYDLTLVDCNIVDVHYDDTQHNQYFAKFYDTNKGSVFIAGEQKEVELIVSPDTIYELGKVDTLSLSFVDGYEGAEISISFIPDDDPSIMITSLNINEIAPFSYSTPSEKIVVTALWNNNRWDVSYSY